MEKVEYLVELDATIHELWDELADLAPEQTTKLRELLTEVGAAQEAAKKDLRAMGPGTHVIGDKSFRVAPGGNKVIFDLDDVLFEAEDNGHLADLIDAGFVKYAIDGKQLERLPDHLKPIYQEMATEKAGTARVFLPKNLCQ